jgi:LEA14-like dessication related protein
VKYKEVTISQISNVKIKKITNDGMELELGMKIKNPNAYSFSVYPSSFHISLSGTDMGVARLSRREHIKANSEDTHTFLIKTSYDKMLQGGLPALLGLFSKNNTEVEIKGNLKAGKCLIRKKIPIDRKQNTLLENNAAGSLFNQK